MLKQIVHMVQSFNFNGATPEYDTYKLNIHFWKEGIFCQNSKL